MLFGHEKVELNLLIRKSFEATEERRGTWPEAARLKGWVGSYHS